MTATQTHPVPRAPQAPFVERHVGPGPAGTARMLATLGLDSLEALVDAAVPESIRLRTPLDLPSARSEVEVLARLREIAAQNVRRVQMIGQGYHDTVTPSVIVRN